MLDRPAPITEKAPNCLIGLREHKSAHSIPRTWFGSLAAALPSAADCRQGRASPPSRARHGHDPQRAPPVRLRPWRKRRDDPRQRRAISPRRRSPRAPRRSTATISSRVTFGRSRRARSARQSPRRRNMAGSRSATWSTAWRWKRCRARAARSGSPMARIRTSASTRSSATATSAQKSALPAEAHLGRACRRARDVGAERRLGRRVDDDAGREAGRPLRHQWREDVDHQRSASPRRSIVYAKTDPAAGPRGITAFMSSAA